MVKCIGKYEIYHTLIRNGNVKKKGSKTVKAVTESSHKVLLKFLEDRLLIRRTKDLVRQMDEVGISMGNESDSHHGISQVVKSLEDGCRTQQTYRPHTVNG